MESHDFLKNRIKKSTKTYQKKMFLLFGIFFSLLSASIINKYTHKKEENSISSLALDPAYFVNLLGVGHTLSSLAAFLHRRKKSVSDDILSKLKYSQKSKDTTSIYAPLNAQDIDNLVKIINFSKLDKIVQQDLLQNLIFISEHSPTVSKLLKSELLYAKVIYNKNLKCSGLTDFKPFILTNSKISLQKENNTCTLLHEIFHLKQIVDGAFYTKKLLPVIHFINEAQTKSFDLLISNIKETDINTIQKNTFNFFIPKMLGYLFQKQKDKNPNKSDLELKANAENEFIVIMTKYLILGSNFHQKNALLNHHYPNLFNSDELIDIYKRTITFNHIYEKSTIDKKRKNNFKISKSELELIPHFNTYYQRGTDIQFNLEHIETLRGNTPLKHLYVHNQTKQKQ